MMKYMIDVGDMIIETTRASGESGVLLVLDVNIDMSTVRHFVFNSTENRITQLIHHIPNCKNDENCVRLVNNDVFKLIKRTL